MKILVVDDTPENSDMISLMLMHNNYEVCTANSGYDALDILNENDIQLAIVDWMMPEMDGIELVRRIRAAFSDRYVYVIMLSAKDTKGDVVFGLESGVDDYMSKPFSARELMARISIGARVVNLESRLSQSLKEAENLAKHDHLTGLFNRRHFFELAVPTFNQSIGTSLPLSVILFDIDHFKKINDTYGHLIGDHVLINVARRCEAGLPERAVIARYGGEEFVVLLPGYVLAEAAEIGERLRLAICEETVDTEGNSVDVTISVGVAALDSSLSSLEAMLNAADMALYSAKQAGRNCLIIFDKDYR